MMKIKTMREITGSSPLPVVMYHSVQDRPQRWIWAHLCISTRVMEWHLRYLRRCGWTTVFLQDVMDYRAGRKKLPTRSIALTFDDGYLDNWVSLFPLLKEYSAKATVFVSLDFIDPASECRPTLEDVWCGRKTKDEINYWGYLSWPELKAMEASGLVDIQSHAKTHTWYPSGPKIMDFHHPQDAYMWLAWNTRPDRKPFWLSEDRFDYVPLGTPVYEHGKALVTRRFFPSPSPTKIARDYVQQHGGKRFFDNPDWRTELEQHLGDLCTDSEGHYESQAEYKARVLAELADSKAEIETHLDKRVDILCWPGGGFNEQALSVAQEVGYRATTVKGERNVPGADPRGIERISFTRHRIGVVPTDVVSVLSWIININAYQGGRVAPGLRQIGRAISKRLP